MCVPNKTEDLNLNVFNLITRINDSKALTKHMSRESKCKCDGKNIIEVKSGITINVSVSGKIQENIMYAKIIIFGILKSQIKYL